MKGHTKTENYAKVRNCNHWIPPDHLARIVRKMSDEDRQIVYALVNSGLRVDDLLAIRDGDLTGDMIAVMERKTGKIRVVDGDGARFIRILRAYTAERAWAQESDYLVPARRVRADGIARHLSRSTVWRAFRRAVHAAGLAGYGYTVHSLRKSFAVNMYLMTGNIAAVQRILGHDRPSTTMIYLADYFDHVTREVIPYSPS